MTELVHLRASDTSLLLALDDGLLPRPVHWGADLGDADLESVARSQVASVPPSAYDEPVPLELIPQHRWGHAGRGGLAGSRAGRDWSSAFVTTDVSHDARAARIAARDDASYLDLVSELALTDQGLLRVRHTVTNTAPEPYDVTALPVQLPVPHRATQLLDLTGRWGRERVPQRLELGYGAWVREARRGRPGHDSPTLMAVGEPGFGFGHGEVWAMHVAWSGDASYWTERLPEGPCALGGGELLQPGEIRLGAGASYTSPWVWFAHSTRGLDGIAQAFHEMLRARPHHPRTPRPAVLNTWEAVYFDHDLERLKAIANTAAEVGVERFVLDDGWFGGRRDDRAGLGDWTVSDAVWPQGLAPLIDHVRSRGLDFGLWVEPEMVNLDSDLAREHPDWLLVHPDRRPPEWRYQHALDLAHPDAFAHVLGRLDALLRDHDIAYLKWDHNRDLADAHHAGAPGVHAQTRALYALLDELRARHPGVEIETCASGGARLDLEILERADRVWTSDCTDALERHDIQRWSMQLVPPELLGAHVSAPRNHQTGRHHDLCFRAGAALFGHFGIEWDVTGADEWERADLAAWIALYKEVRGLLHTGRVVRGDGLGPDRLLDGVVAGDGSDALYRLTAVTTSVGSVPAPVRLPGLDAEASYDVTVQAPGDSPHTLDLRPVPWISDGGIRLSGKALATTGLACPVLGPGQLLLLRATRCK